MPKATATDPPFTNSPTMHSRMVGKDKKKSKQKPKLKREKKHAKPKFLGVDQIYGYAY